MGKIVFEIPPNQKHVDAARQAYLASAEGIPWVTQTRWANHRLVFEKAFPDSAILYYPWKTSKGSWVTLRTATLMEKAEEPYDLSLELARGTIAQLREFFWELEAAGVPLPQEAGAQIQGITREFAKAVVGSKGDPSRWRLCTELIEEALAVGRSVSRHLCEYVLAARARQQTRLPTLLGVSLGEWRPEEPVASLLQDIFHAALVPMLWRKLEAVELRWDWSLPDQQIDWCRQAGLRVCAGPLLTFSPRYFPLFMEAYTGDQEALSEACLVFVQHVVQRYRGKVQAWLCGGRVNTGEVLILSEEERLELVAQAAATIHRLDPGTPLILCLDQPWGEYLTNRPAHYPPLQLAEALLRSGLPLAGILLELAYGYYPGSFRRDWVQVHRLLDWWGTLDTPLLVWLVLPSSTEADSNVVLSGRAAQPGASLQSQSLWTEELLLTLFARPQVQAVFWGEAFDHLPHEYPHSGLFDHAKAPKPVCSVLQRFRRRWLA
jgi:hypothetical protein